jgi:hypothetical protein
VNIGDFSHHRFLSKVSFAKKSEQNLSPIVSKKFILLLMCFAFHLTRLCLLPSLALFSKMTEKGMQKEYNNFGG